VEFLRVFFGFIALLTVSYLNKNVSLIALKLSSNLIINLSLANGEIGIRASLRT